MTYRFRNFKSSWHFFKIQLPSVSVFLYVTWLMVFSHIVWLFLVTWQFSNFQRSLQKKIKF